MNELAHRYLHSLPRDKEEVINDMLRQFKLQGGIIVPTQEGALEVQQPIQIEFNFDMSDCITIPVHNNTKEDYEKRQKFNRAKEKRKTERFIQDELEFMEQLEDENER